MPVAATTPATAAERRTHAFTAVVSSTGDTSISDTFIAFDVMLSAAGDEMLHEYDITTLLLATALQHLQFYRRQATLTLLYNYCFFYTSGECVVVMFLVASVCL